jgi:hypothetical protein
VAKKELKQGRRSKGGKKRTGTSNNGENKKESNKRCSGLGLSARFGSPPPSPLNLAFGDLALTRDIAIRKVKIWKNNSK